VPSLGPAGSARKVDRAPRAALCEAAWGGGAHQRHFPPGEAPSLVAGAFEREPTKAVFAVGHEPRDRVAPRRERLRQTANSTTTSLVATTRMRASATSSLTPSLGHGVTVEPAAYRDHCPIGHARVSQSISARGFGSVSSHT
jgi:hypothetical protein